MKILNPSSRLGLRRTLLATAIGMAANSAHAVDIYADQGAGSADAACGTEQLPCKWLSDAVSKAVSAGDRVLLRGTTPFLTRGLYIVEDITIEGVDRDTSFIDGRNESPHFFVENSATLTLENVSLARGFASNGCGGSVEVDDGGRLEARGARFADNTAACGGAVYVGTGSLLADDVEFIGNEATDTFGGAIYCESRSARGGPVCDDVELFDSVFDGNAARTDGGAVFSMAVTTIRRSDFHANTGHYGGAIHFEPSSDAELNVKRSQFSANEGVYGGAVSAELGNYGGKVEVRRSSFHQNVGEIGGAMFLAGNSLSQESLEVINSTFAENVATVNGGGAIYGAGSVYFSTFIDQVAPAWLAQDLHGTFELYRSLITKRDVPQGLDECSWPALNGASNLLDGTSCGIGLNFRTDAHDNLTLGSLGLWGGRTLSYKILPGSNAINTANNCRGANGPVATDQRGDLRPAVGNSCDIGSYEFQQ